jgi:hypothetical protein
MAGSRMRSPGRKGSCVEFGDHISKTRSPILTILAESLGNCLRLKPIDELMLGTSRYPAAHEMREWPYWGLWFDAGMMVVKLRKEEHFALTGQEQRTFTLEWVKVGRKR